MKTQKYTYTQARCSCEDRGRDWRDASISQGTPRIVGCHQKLTEAKKDSSLESSQGA